ncbi:MAG: hypothetical protein JWO05_911 [Gemmatimonadetes bacterium]|nr:hypothetical protein [Gemmatimonadota bacterium]
MKNLFEPATVAEVKARLDTVTPGSVRQWGKMTAPQALAHMARGMEMATGERRKPRMLIGRVLGGIIKPLALGNDQPMKRNSPTTPDLVVADEHDLEQERAGLHQLIDRFVAAGPAGCSTHPHPFFGTMTPQQWSILMYKHLDHHLRQFGA